MRGKGWFAMYGMNYGQYPFIGAQNAPQAPFMPSAMSTPVQPVTPPSASPAFLQVGTAKEFDNVTIQPGRQALIMAQNDPYIAFKSADAMGMVTTSLYRLEPVTAEQMNGPAVEYATKGELAQLQQVVQQLIDEINKPTRQTKKEAAE